MLASSMPVWTWHRRCARRVVRIACIRVSWICPLPYNILDLRARSIRNTDRLDGWEAAAALLETQADPGVHGESSAH